MTRTRKVLWFMLITFVALSSSACAASESLENCNLEIKASSFGQVHLKENLDTIKIKFDVEITTVESEPNILLYNIKHCEDVNISAIVGKDGNIFMLKAASPSLLYHGYKFSNLDLGVLNSLTENNNIYWVQDEGKKYLFRPHGSNLTFSLGYDAISGSCMNDPSSCTAEEQQIRPREVFTY